MNHTGVEQALTVGAREERRPQLLVRPGQDGSQVYRSPGGAALRAFGDIRSTVRRFTIHLACHLHVVLMCHEFRQLRCGEGRVRGRIPSPTLVSPFVHHIYFSPCPVHRRVANEDIEGVFECQPVPGRPCQLPQSHSRICGALLPAAAPVIPVALGPRVRSLEVIAGAVDDLGDVGIDPSAETRWHRRVLDRIHFDRCGRRGHNRMRPPPGFSPRRLDELRELVPAVVVANGGTEPLETRALHPAVRARFTRGLAQLHCGCNEQKSTASRARSGLDVQAGPNAVAAMNPQRGHEEVLAAGRCRCLRVDGRHDTLGAQARLALIVLVQVDVDPVEPMPAYHCQSAAWLELVELRGVSNGVLPAPAQKVASPTGAATRVPVSSHAIGLAHEHGDPGTDQPVSYVQGFTNRRRPVDRVRSNVDAPQAHFAGLRGQPLADHRLLLKQIPRATMRSRAALRTPRRTPLRPGGVGTAIGAHMDLLVNPGVDVGPPVEHPAPIPNEPRAASLVAQLSQSPGRRTHELRHLFGRRQLGFDMHHHNHLFICLEITRVDYEQIYITETHCRSTVVISSKLTACESPSATCLSSSVPMPSAYERTRI
ncbi:hypothetical protein RHCRD62_90097 [Rhodococcus sp. RD6.2]|nr:hypothetical protein RHCRD62_90097 [Rhodococcus sp. RD6.2]